MQACRSCVRVPMLRKQRGPQTQQAAYRRDGHHPGVRHVSLKQNNKYTRLGVPPHKFLVHTSGSDGSSDGSIFNDEVALPNGNLGFGFSAGGLLFPYYIGVIMTLRDELRLLQEDTPVAGASAGSLIAATAKSGISEEDLLEATLQLARDCRNYGTRFRLRSVLDATLEKVLPDDIHDRCSGNVHVAVTNVWPKLKPQLICQYQSRRELIDTLLVSCHIPWYFDGSLVTRFGDGLAFDGGITNLIPIPPGCSTPVRVSCFPAKDLSMFKGIGISPDCFGQEWPFSMKQMIGWALEPAPEDMLLFLVDKGKKDARTWAFQSGLVPGDIAMSEASSSRSASGIYLP